jgi:hypothetical protein
MIALASFSGKMSIFGGPDDPGVGLHEGLALYDTPQQFDALGLSHLLLDTAFSTWPTIGLARLLNPESYYIACRWDEHLRYNPLWLRSAKITVSNHATGSSINCHAVDYGPAGWTHRCADLSPGAAAKLFLCTDDLCSVTVWQL